MRPIALLLALSIAACASSGRKIDPSETASITPGKTTRAELIEKFGPPGYQGKDAATGNLAANWTYAHVGFAGIGTEVQTMYVVFDANDVVDKVTYTGSK